MQTYEEKMHDVRRQYANGYLTYEQVVIEKKKLDKEYGIDGISSKRSEN